MSENQEEISNGETAFEVETLRKALKESENLICKLSAEYIRDALNYIRDAEDRMINLINEITEIEECIRITEDEIIIAEERLRRIRPHDFDDQLGNYPILSLKFIKLNFKSFSSRHKVMSINAYYDNPLMSLWG